VVLAANDGSYRFTGLADGQYLVVAGSDADGDARYGAPMQPWGAFGRSVDPDRIRVAGAGDYSASFTMNGGAEWEPNNTASSPDLRDALWPSGYITGGISSQTDIDLSFLPITQAGSYVIEVSGQVGACGFSVELDPVLTLIDGSGTILQTNDNINAPNRDLCARITRQLGVGIYTVRVEGATVSGGGKSQGRYVLSARLQ
jgi:hypothetical protein